MGIVTCCDNCKKGREVWNVLMWKIIVGKFVLKISLLINISGAADGRT